MHPEQIRPGRKLKPKKNECDWRAEEEVAPEKAVEKKALANKWSASAENLVLADSDSDSGSDSYSDSSPRTPHVFSKVPDPPPAGAPSQRRRSGAVTEAMIKQIGNNQLDGEGKAGENEIKLNKDKPPVFDTLTIRTWFMMADKDNSGSISKKEFIQFLIENKQLATMLMQKLGDKGGEQTLEWFVKKFQETEHQRVARVYRRLLGFYKTIDADKNGSLTVFRRRFRSTGVRSGSVRGPFGAYSGSVRSPFGVRAGSARVLFGVRSRSVRGA